MASGVLALVEARLAVAVHTAALAGTGTASFRVAVNLIASAEVHCKVEDTEIVLGQLVADKDRHLDCLGFLIALHFSLPAT